MDLLQLLTERSLQAHHLNSTLHFLHIINFKFYIDIYILFDYIDHRERIQEFKVGLLHFG